MMLEPGGKHIYVATKGEYSDYHIVGVFESAEEASKYGEAETYKLHQCPSTQLRKCWVVTVKNVIFWQRDKRHADEVEDFWISDPVQEIYAVSANARGLLISGCNYEPRLQYETTLASFVSAEHARKLAVELIQDCLRQYHLSPWAEERTQWSPKSKEETDGEEEPES